MIILQYRSNFMNINTPLFQIYGRALTGNSLLGFASIGIEKLVLNDLENKKSYHCLSALKQICEFAAAVKIMQAACLAVGQVRQSIGHFDCSSHFKNHRCQFRSIP